jgi:symplekin
MAAEDGITPLKQAEALVLQDPSHYPAILPGVIALTTRAELPVRRWIATFLINTFASKVLDVQTKEDLSVLVIDGLQKLIDEDSDPGVVKSCVLCSSLIYPLLFRRVYSPSLKPWLIRRGKLNLLCRCKNPTETQLWVKLTQLKSKIVKLSEHSINHGVRIACVKFVEKVIATQTPGIKDPRVTSISDLSLLTCS